MVYGQSFILHQIRKMVGTALAVFRGAAPENAIASALRREGDVATPMAPELGLFLAETVYGHYNKTWAGDNGREEDDDDDEGDEEDDGDREKGENGGKIDPALQQQYQQEQEEQRARRKQRECLSLGAWGDAAENFKVRLFMFLFLRSSSSSSSSSFPLFFFYLSHLVLPPFFSTN